MFRKIWTWSQAATKKHKIVGYRRLNKCISSTQAISNEFKATNPNWLTWGKSRYLVQGDPHHLLIQDSLRSSSIHSWYFRKNKVWLLKPSDSWYGYIMRYCPYEILWTSQEKRLYDANAPTTWTISTFTTKSSICRTSLIASNNQTENVNLTTVAYMCVVSLRYPPFSSCMQGFQKKMGDFHFYCVSLFLVTWSREARRCWLNSKTWQNNKSTSSSQVENMLNIHYNKCMKHFLHIVTI